MPFNEIKVIHSKDKCFPLKIITHLTRRLPNLYNICNICKTYLAFVLSSLFIVDSAKQFPAKITLSTLEAISCKRKRDIDSVNGQLYS